MSIVNPAEASGSANRHGSKKGVSLVTHSIPIA
jgi:hypothetical protein